MIDLHTHTTASDGLCSPAELVSRAKAAGVTVLSVTDHDTLAGCDEAAQACRTAGLEFVPGIEITAIADRQDVHVLGYFLDPHDTALQHFLDNQRRKRIERVRAMVERLAEHGIVLNADAIVEPGLTDVTKTIGRPAIARTLVHAGMVASTTEAFDKWLARGRPAFVPREGAEPAEVIARIHHAGGLASLAHPGLLARDAWIAAFVDAGLDALEAYHSEHDADATSRYLAMSDTLHVAVTGGTDYHADESHGAAGLGSVSLPPERFDALRRLAASRATASGAPTSS